MTDSASGSGGGVEPSGLTNSEVSEVSSNNSTGIEGVNNTTAEVPSGTSQTTNPTTEANSPTVNMNRRESAQPRDTFRMDQAPTGLRGIRTFLQQWARNNGLALPTGSNPDDIDVERAGNRSRMESQINMSNSGPLPSGSVSNVGLSSRGRSSPSHRRGSVSVDTVNGEASSPTGGSHREAFVLDMEGMSNWTANGTPNGPADDSSRRQSEEGSSNMAARRSPPFDMEDSGIPSLEGNEADSPPSGERDRSPADILRDSPETRAFITEINRYTTLRPFVLIMLLKGLLDHGSGIICFLAMVVTFSHANSLLKKEVSKQKKRNLLFLAMICVNLMGCAGFIYYVFSEEELYYALGYMKTKVEITSFWTLMWVVGVSDYVAKFGAVITKVLIVGMPAGLLPYQKRGKYYLFIEQTFQLYRSFLPVHHWLVYLINSYSGATKTFGLLLAGMYTLFKLTDSVQRVKDWNSAFHKLLQTVHYGSTPTVKEMDSVGPTCPICHDTFTCPTRLSCTHIFCEECVSTWFDRERTCPMCRAKVVDDPTFRDGSTSQYVQLF